MRALAVAEHVVSITQHGSTRSINVAAAAAIAMHAWAVTHLGLGTTPTG